MRNTFVLLAILGFTYCAHASEECEENAEHLKLIVNGAGRYVVYKSEDFVANQSTELKQSNLRLIARGEFNHVPIERANANGYYKLISMRSAYFLCGWPTNRKGMAIDRAGYKSKDKLADLAVVKTPVIGTEIQTISKISIQGVLPGMISTVEVPMEVNVKNHQGCVNRINIYLKRAFTTSPSYRLYMESDDARIYFANDARADLEVLETGANQILSDGSRLGTVNLAVEFDAMGKLQSYNGGLQAVPLIINWGKRAALAQAKFLLSLENIEADMTSKTLWHRQVKAISEYTPQTVTDVSIDRDGVVSYTCNDIRTCIYKIPLGVMRQSSEDESGIQTPGGIELNSAYDNGMGVVKAFYVK